LASTERLALDQIQNAGPGTSVIVYCSVGYRSARLAQRLRARGYEVSNLEGSIFEWANEDRALYQGDRRVSGVHPYDSTWGRLLERDKWEFPD
jgi:3-mercaptopyruvate sulfurtransferase SseA